MSFIYMVFVVVFAIHAIRTHFRMNRVISGKENALNEIDEKAIKVRIKMIEDMKKNMGDNWKITYRIVSLVTVILLAIFWPVTLGMMISNNFHHKNK